MRQRHTIINRSGLKVVIVVESNSEDHNRLAFIAHGQKGSKNQPHIMAFSRAFLENGYTVVRFDATHAAGESEGALIDVTYDSYISDLEDVIEWSRSHDWFVEPFALCGHSMGAQSTAWYAEHHPQSVSLLLPMAPVVNYDLYCSTMDPMELEQYKIQGYKEVTSSSQPGAIHRIGWQCLESLKRFDILASAKNLTMPILNIVGSEDTSCPPKHQEVFLSKIPNSEKELVIIEGLQHSYRNSTTDKVDDGLKKVEEILSGWLAGEATRTV